MVDLTALNKAVEDNTTLTAEAISAITAANNQSAIDTVTAKVVANNQSLVGAGLMAPPSA